MAAAPRRAAQVLPALALAVAACSPLPAPQAPDTAPAPAARTESAEVAALRRYYGEVQGTLLSRGLLRTDSGSPDAPWSARQLSDNFLRIALYDEFAATPSGFVARETESRLRRWSAPVRVSLRFGDSVPPERRATERARVASFLARMQAITGHPIALTDGPGNFVIAYLDADELRDVGPMLRATIPGLTAAELTAFTRMDPTTYCQVSAMSGSVSSTYERAFAVIRSEHPDLMSLACLHEEVAQGLGLPNDSPRARPSVFNDDQEFALLTPMDEAMLAMLYDPRLQPGMTAESARPVVEMLARERRRGET
jgi:hypothetical protein